MHPRAYRPEVPVCLEDRSLQSGFAVRPAHPVVLLHRQLNFVITHMQNGFVLFSRFHDVAQVRREINDVVVMIPFQRLDGLDVSLDRVVDTMVQQFAAHVPGAIRSASNDVTAVTIADVKAQVRAGDVIVR